MTSSSLRRRRTTLALAALVFSGGTAVAGAHAIAYDNASGIIGFAQDGASRSVARDEALATCQGSGGGRCRIVWQATGSVCVALAATGEDSYTIVESGSMRGAENGALNACEADFGESCYVEISFCGN